MGELHGFEKQPFANFTEDGTYVEAVTLPMGAAVELLRAQGFDAEPPLRGVYMRYSSGAEEIQRAGGETDDAWLECAEDHPDAVPFWKDAP